jgi:hypothetical protein
MFVKITSLRHHPLNKDIYQLSSIGDLMDSIKTVGLLQPLTIDQHHQVISGNRRFEAIKRLGWEEVEVIQVDVEDEHIPVYLIHFNKQRVKTSQELINEYDILYEYYGLGQGKRTDLTSVQLDKGSARDKIRGEIGISSGHLARLLYIRNHQPEMIDLIDRGIMSGEKFSICGNPIEGIW